MVFAQALLYDFHFHDHEILGLKRQDFPFCCFLRIRISFFYPTPETLHSTHQRRHQIYGSDCEGCRRVVESQCSGFKSRG